MSQAKHTPGPWHVVETICGNNQVLGVTTDGGKNGFQISLLPTATERDRADARLIAAAPDLLSAAEIARATIETLMQMFGPDPAGTALLTLNTLDSAITKAEGKSPQTAGCDPK